MNKHITVLLIIHLFLHLNVCAATWNKCCEPFSNLIKISQNNTQIYQCTNYTENIIPLKTNIPGYGIPEDCSGNLTCIDKLIVPTKSNGEIIALNCDTRNTIKPKLPSINKCCPDGSYYNKRNQKCEFEATSTIQKLQDEIADTYNINYGFPVCPRRLTIEQEYEDISTKIINGSLELTHQQGNLTFLPGEYCIDIREKNHILSAIVVLCSRLGENVKEVCTANICVPKCCPFGHIYKEGKVKLLECFPGWGIPFQPPFYNVTTASDFYLLTAKLTCSFGKYIKDDFVLFENGTIHLSNTQFFNSYMNKYCIEILNTSKMQNYIGVGCMPPEKIDFSSKFLHLVPLLISILFLGITLTIYFFLPELQNLHGRIVMSHTASLLVAYICLALVKQRRTKFGPTLCIIIGYGILFTFLSAFTWLNVMCFDIWRTFGTV